MARQIIFRRKISVRLYLRLAKKNKDGFCPVRLTARWHAEELQLDTGELVQPEQTGKGGKVEVLWDEDAGRVLRGHDQYVYINSRLAEWERDVTDAFGRLFDAAPFERVTKVQLKESLFPPVEETEPMPAVSRTFRQVLEEWKEETATLARTRCASTISWPR